jgi:hypothetical protein
LGELVIGRVGGSAICSKATFGYLGRRTYDGCAMFT